jgi:hypothetical protein
MVLTGANRMMLVNFPLTVAGMNDRYALNLHDYPIPVGGAPDMSFDEMIGLINNTSTKVFYETVVPVPGEIVRPRWHGSSIKRVGRRDSRDARGIVLANDGEHLLVGITLGWFLWRGDAGTVNLTRPYV